MLVSRYRLSLEFFLDLYEPMDDAPWKSGVAPSPSTASLSADEQRRLLQTLLDDRELLERFMQAQLIKLLETDGVAIARECLGIEEIREEFHIENVAGLAENLQLRLTSFDHGLE